MLSVVLPIATDCKSAAAFLIDDLRKKMPKQSFQLTSEKGALNTFAEGATLAELID